MKGKNAKNGCSRINILFEILDHCPALERDEVIDAWKQEMRRPHYHEAGSRRNLEERTGNTLIFRNARITDYIYHEETHHLTLEFSANSKSYLGRRKMDGRRIGSPKQNIRLSFDGKLMAPWRFILTGSKEHLYTFNDVIKYTKTSAYQLELETEIVDNYINPLNMNLINLMVSDHLITCERDMLEVLKMKKHQQVKGQEDDKR